MLGNLFKAFFACGSGFLRAGTQVAVELLIRDLAMVSSFLRSRPGLCLPCRLPPKQSVEQQESVRGVVPRNSFEGLKMENASARRLSLARYAMFSQMISSNGFSRGRRRGKHHSVAGVYPTSLGKRNGRLAHPPQSPHEPLATGGSPYAYLRLVMACNATISRMRRNQVKTQVGDLRMRSASAKKRLISRRSCCLSFGSFVPLSFDMVSSSSRWTCVKSRSAMQDWNYVTAF